MRNKNRLAGEILDHLQLYRDLGVRYSSLKPRAVGRESSTPAPKGHSRQEKTPPDVSTPPAQSRRIVLPPTSMFDEMPTGAESLEQVREDLGDCRRCKLAPMRKHIVFGTGNPKAELMFVGEAPGSDEDEQGLPFVGRAGQLLTKIIEAMGMGRDQVYICNILKCRPPENRNPEPDEIASCEPFLFRQVASVKPKVICALGTFGAHTLLKTKEPISRLRGQFLEYRGTKLMATFHPAYLLRNPGEKRKVWEDVQKIRDYLRTGVAR